MRNTVGEAHPNGPWLLFKGCMYCILSYHRSFTTACWRNLLRPVSFMHHPQQNCIAACWKHLGPGDRLLQINRTLDPQRSSARGTVLTSVCRAALSSCMCQFGRGAFLSQRAFSSQGSTWYICSLTFWAYLHPYDQPDTLSNLGSFPPQNQ